MSKKIFIYGLAFGSACAAINYLYAATYVYKQSLGYNAFFASLEFLILPFIGIFLFLKSFKAQMPEQFTFGKAVFMGFFVSVMIGATVSLACSYFINFNHFYLTQMIDYKIATHIKNLKTKVEIDNAIKMIKDGYSGSGIFTSQMVLSSGRGLFFSAIIAYILKARMISAEERANTEKNIEANNYK